MVPWTTRVITKYSCAGYVLHNSNMSWIFLPLELFIHIDVHAGPESTQLSGWTPEFRPAHQIPCPLHVILSELWRLVLIFPVQHPGSMPELFHLLPTDWLTEFLLSSSCALQKNSFCDEWTRNQLLMPSSNSHHLDLPPPTGLIT